MNVNVNQGKLQTSYKSSSLWSIWFTEFFNFLLLFFHFPSFGRRDFLFLVLFFVCLWCSHGKLIFRKMKKIFIYVFLILIWILCSMLKAKKSTKIKSSKEVNNRKYMCNMNSKRVSLLSRWLFVDVRTKHSMVLF